MGSLAMATGSLLDLPWAQELANEQGMKTLLTGKSMDKLDQVPLADALGGLDPDHLFLSLLRQDLLHDLLFLWSPTQKSFHTLMSIGGEVCGHPTIVHGGLTSAIIDQTTGCLVYALKQAGQLGEGMALTARLEVDYKRPMPARSDVVCTARLEKVEGRKIWVTAEVADRPGGTVYAAGRALFVTPKQQPSAPQK